MLAQFPVYAKDYLHGDHSVFVLLLTVFSLGVGSGSLLCERLSGRKVEIGLVPFGSIGLSLFGADLYLSSNGFAAAAASSAALAAGPHLDAFAMMAQHGMWRILLDVLMIGMFGGFFIVPLFALIQTRCDPAHMSRTIAGMNILNALFMVAAAGLAIVLLGQGFTIPQLFLVTAGAERDRGAVYLLAGAGVPDALPGVEADPHRAPRTHHRRRPHSWPKGRRCWCVTTSATSTPSSSARPARAPDPLRDGPPHLQAAAAGLDLPHRARDSDRAGPRKTRG